MATDKKISELTGYTPAVDTDVLPINDTTTSTTKKITWANIKATLKTYFDTLYQAVLGLTSNVSGTGFTITGGATPKTLTVPLDATVSGSNTGDQTLPVKATGAEVDTGTDDAKFATAKAIKDSHNVPSVAPSTIGNVLTSDGTDWVSQALSVGVSEFATITLSAAQLASIYATPVEIIPTPGAGKIIIIESGLQIFTYGGVQATTGDVVSLVEGTTLTSLSAGGISQTEIRGVSSINKEFTRVQTTTTGGVRVENKPILLSMSNSAFNGTSTLKVIVKYSIFTL